MAIMVEKISAVTFRVSNMKASVQFYRDVLGMELLYGGETAGFSSLRAKDANSAILNLEQGKPVVNTVPQAKFGLAFNESSGPCLTRAEGNDDELQFRRCGSRILRAVQDVETRLITHYNGLCCHEANMGDRGRGCSALAHALGMRPEPRRTIGSSTTCKTWLHPSAGGDPNTIPDRTSSDRYPGPS